MDGALKTPGLLYLHGFCSSPASWKARLLLEALAARGLGEHAFCPQLPPAPATALAELSAWTESFLSGGGVLTVIGSSLGGHYATCLAERFGLKAVLINPAVVADLDMSRFIGEHVHFHSGEPFTFTTADAAALQAQVALPQRGDYWLLLEEGDEVLDFRQAQTFYAKCRQSALPGGDHSFTRFPEYLPQILEFAGL